MSERLINDLTLQYLTSKEFESKVQNTPRPTSKQVKKDRIFYKKRVLDLTRRLMRDILGKEPCDDDPPLQVSADVQNTFENYLRSCIEFFKITDQTGIIQEEYDGYQEEQEHDKNGELAEEEKGQQYADELFMKNIQMKSSNTLDKFVLKRIKKSDKNSLEKLPKKKDINLNDPSLKLKGIGKKKNLGNKYEEKSKEANKGQETRGGQQKGKESENKK